MSAPIISSARAASAQPSSAAQGLEAILLRQMIGAMRRAGGDSGGLFDNAAQAQFRELFDARLADSMAAHAGGIGIGRMIDRQIGAVATPAPTAPPVIR